MTVDLRHPDQDELDRLDRAINEILSQAGGALQRQRRICSPRAA